MTTDGLAEALHRAEADETSFVHTMEYHRDIADRLAPWLAEHDAEVWEAGVDAMASASIMRMNTNDVKRNNPHRGSHHAGCYLLTQRDLSHDNCDCLCHPSRENKRPDHG